ncbi:MAG: hypothetical protein AMXMBFR33_38530 [Candidatus Xenobia bacterium]|jgi:2',3'-cyclic-nucleotide 2'-phosphodiesterase (5'-nucleotidase family)
MPDIVGAGQKGGLRDRVSIVTMDGLHGCLLDQYDPKTPGLVTGGAALLSSEIRRKRQEAGELLLLSGGDFFQGPPISTMFDGEPVIRLMNRDRFDAMTLGNHDFDKGQQVLSQRIQQAQFPVIAANLLDDATGRHISESAGHALAKVGEYFTKKIGLCTVAVIGLMKEESGKTTHPDNVNGLRFEDPVETLSRLVPKICEEERPDVLVLQYQLLREGGTDLAAQAAELAEEASGKPIPVVLMGGHGYTDFQEPRVGENTLVVQSGDRGEELSELDLRLAPGTAQVVGFEHRRVPINSAELEPDPEVMQLLEGYKARLGERMGEVVAHNEAPLTRDKVKDSPLGNLVTDLLRDATGSDVAVIPGGSLKDDINPGPVDVGEVYSAFPFDSHVVKVDMTGRDLKRLMEESLSLKAGKVLQVSGLEISFDPEKPPGERIVEINTPDGKPLGDDQVYHVTADDFLLAGGDNYTAMKAREAEHGHRVRDVLVDQMRQRGTIALHLGGDRIREACAVKFDGSISA